MNLPAEYLDRMQKRLGEGFPAFLRAMEQPPLRGVRANTLKLSPAAFADLFPHAGDPVPWEKAGFYTDAERLGAFPAHHAGLFYAQEPSAMCAAPLLDARPEERVLDLCAAPGGKTTQLAAAMGGGGVLIANEYVYDRARILSQNVERLGVKNCAVVSADPAALARRFPAYFDKILVDAPCSGEGMFRKDENAIAEWSEENVSRCAVRQAAILDEAAAMLRGGGRLVYSTCTFERAENEGQIEAFLARHAEFTLIGEEMLFPHEVRGEGHFAALLEKSGAERPPARGTADDAGRRQNVPAPRGNARPARADAARRDRAGRVRRQAVHARPRPRHGGYKRGVRPFPAPVGGGDGEIPARRDLPDGRGKRLVRRRIRRLPAGAGQDCGRHSQKSLSQGVAQTIEKRLRRTEFQSAAILIR